jgi:hypothetical protein
MNFDFGGNVDGMANVDRWAGLQDLPGESQRLDAPERRADRRLQAAERPRCPGADRRALPADRASRIGRRLTVAPGVRFEHTRGRAAGPADIGQRETDRRVFGTTAPTGTVDRTTAEYLQTRYGGGRVYATAGLHTWLRYLHTTYRFNEDLVLKTSWNQAISRPDMNRLIGGLVVTNDDPNNPQPNRANAGNANLRPELSNTINADPRVLHARHRPDHGRRFTAATSSS